MSILPKRNCPLGYQYGEEFGKINVLRKLPAIKDGDFCLAERYVVYGMQVISCFQFNLRSNLKKKKMF